MTIVTTPPIIKIIAFKNDGLDDYYVVERSDGSISEVWNPLTAGCPDNVWNAYCREWFAKANLTNEQIHASLGIADEHNPEGGWNGGFSW